MVNSVRVAIVTGSARGIGAAIALQLARDGFHLVLNDMKSNYSELEHIKKDVETVGQIAHIVTTDVSVEKEVQDMIEESISRFGRLDVMVANAGILQVTDLLETTAEDWDQIMAVNARGVFLCYKYAARAMIKQGLGGRIIGAASLAGKQGVVYAPAYSASKFAVRGLTQCAAQELGKHGITVNAYAPGPIANTQINPMPESAFIDVLQRLNALGSVETVVGRPGQPDEVARLVSYLASEHAGFITGQTISINGGQFFD